MPSRFIPIPFGTDPAQQVAAINTNFAQLDNENVSKLFYDSNGIPSISIGVQQDKTSRIRISKPGVDVTTATDSQLAFNSAQNVFKIVSSMTISNTAYTTATAAAGQVATDVSITSVAHGLSYVPAVVAFIDTGGVNYQPLPRLSFAVDAGNIKYLQTVWQIYADLTHVHMEIDCFLSAIGAASGVNATVGVFSLKVFLLQETAN